MIVTKVMDVSAEEYFDYIVNALYKELKKIGIKSLKRSEVKAGYKFVKKYKQGKNTFTVDCTIEELDYPNKYRILMKAPTADQTIIHTVTKVSENQISLDYEELVDSNSIFVKFNKFIQARKSKATMKQTLEILEKAIIDEREQKDKNDD